MLYGFIEQFWARHVPLSDEHIVMTLSGDTPVVAVDKDDFEKFFNAHLEYWIQKSRYSTREDLRPCIVDSTTDGMKVILSFISHDDYLIDTITSEAVKQTETYRAIKNLQDPISRFSYGYFIETLVEYWSKEEPKVVVPPLVDELPESAVDQIMQKLDTYGMNPRKVCDNGYVAGSGQHPSSILVKKMVRAVEKTVIFITNSSSQSSFYSAINKADVLKVEKEVLIIFTNMSPDERFATIENGLLPIIYGVETYTLFHVAGSHMNDDIASDREANRDVSDKLSKHSCYSKYDFIFKDHVTNVVWAVKERCYIYLLTSATFAYQYDLFDILINKLINKRTFDQAYEEDMKIYLQKSIDFKTSFIEKSVDTSDTVINELQADFESTKAIHDAKMMEAMKAGQRMVYLMNQIKCFDVCKYQSEQKKRAEEDYDLISQIKKINTIYMDGGYAHIFTKNLYCMDERTRRYHDIGTFHITINMFDKTYSAGSTVKIRNTKHQITAFGGHKMEAPHVFQDGHLCHGTLEQGMVEAYRNRNIYQMVMQLLMFLENANTEDAAGQYVDKWPEVSEDIALGKKVDYVDELMNFLPNKGAV